MSDTGITHWKNNHSHNEFLQAFTSGGLLMFVFSLFIFIRIYYLIKKNKIDQNINYIVYLNLFYFSLSMTTISYNFSIISGLIWLFLISLENNSQIIYEDNN